MLVTVETPKWSFIKYRLKSGRPVKDLTSPLPSLFNYGFVGGTRGADGMEEDVIVLGPPLRPGDKVKVKAAGVVRFIDDGVVDDKKVASADGGISIWDIVEIHIFFSAYSVFKTIHYLIWEGRLTVCRYGGFNRLRGRRRPGTRRIHQRSS